MQCVVIYKGKMFIKIMSFSCVVCTVSPNVSPLKYTLSCTNIFQVVLLVAGNLKVIFVLPGEPLGR